MRTLRITLAAFLILIGSVATFLSQETGKQPGAIKPAPPKGKGVVVLRAARLIDGTGSAHLATPL